MIVKAKIIASSNYANEAVFLSIISSFWDATRIMNGSDEGFAAGLFISYILKVNSAGEL